MAKPKDPFSDPLLSRQHLKIAVEGNAGVGKTHFALTFPNPCVIDPEHGTDLFIGRKHKTKEGDKEFTFRSNHTRSIYDAIDIVEALLVEQYGYETLIIDPITLFWEAAQDGYSAQLEKKIRSGRSRRPDNELQFGDWKEIKRPYKRLMSRLLSLPMHVVLIGRLSDNYKVSGGQVEKVGESMDAEKSTEYNVDIVLRLDKQLKKRIGTIRKDRSQLFEGKTLENPNFETFKPILDRLESLKEKGVKTGGQVETADESAERDASAMSQTEQSKTKEDLWERIQKGGEALKGIGHEATFADILKKNKLDLSGTTIVDQSIPMLQATLKLVTEAYKSTSKENK